MIAIGMIALWAGYGVGSWGYVLVRGWDITFTQWFSPLNPYQWPKSGEPPFIPKGALLPGQSPASAAAGRPGSPGGATGFIEGLAGGAAGNPQGALGAAEGAAGGVAGGLG